MKKLLPIAALALLTGCTAAKSPDLAAELQNPLYAEQYYDAQVEYMVNMVIGEDPLTKDDALKAVIDAARLEGLKNARVATDAQAKGKMGVVMSDLELVHGEVLLLESALYTGPEFAMTPGINVHAYLSGSIDPRAEETFPDESAIDLGAVRGSFGAMKYVVPVNAAENSNTFILYDEELKRIVGFAQLTGRN